MGDSNQKAKRFAAIAPCYSGWYDEVGNHYPAIDLTGVAYDVTVTTKYDGGDGRTVLCFDTQILHCRLDETHQKYKEARALLSETQIKITIANLNFICGGLYIGESFLQATVFRMWDKKPNF